MILIKKWLKEIHIRANTMYNINTLCHKLLKPHLNDKSIVVDATAGGGNDTLFLCQNANFIYAFDIQKQAMIRTINRLFNYDNYKFILDSHINIRNYLNHADLIMFNFGYLPNSDSSLTSTSDTSLLAIKESLKLLNSGGILSICLYPGHSEGAIEAKVIIPYICSLPYHYQMMQNKKDGPILIIVYIT